MRHGFSLRCNSFHLNMSTPSFLKLGQAAGSLWLDLRGRELELKEMFRIWKRKKSYASDMAPNFLQSRVLQYKIKSLLTFKNAFYRNYQSLERNGDIYTLQQTNHTKSVLLIDHLWLSFEDYQRLPNQRLPNHIA